MREVLTVLWREWVFFKHRFVKITAAQIVTPILYLVAFGWGVGQNLQMDGNQYMSFILPGVVALTSMRTSYSAISMRVSVTRLHERSFESYLAAPIQIHWLAIGHILAGALRGLYASILILLVGIPFGVIYSIDVPFLFVSFLNGIMFAALGFFAAMMIDTHYDMNQFTSFVITPMGFLCGTFFSLKKLPWLLRQVIELLPLTHSTRLLRAIVLGGRIEMFSFLVMLIYAGIFTLLSIRACYEEVV